MGLKYNQITDGDILEIDLDPLDWRIKCCDCGMVHLFQFKKVKRSVYQITITQEPRRTAQARRHKAGDLHQGVGGWKMVRGE